MCTDAKYDRVASRYDTALETLERANWEADYVITHCAPTSVALAMSQHNEPDRIIK